MPKVTIITGYYNRGAVLERTIKSIMSQTFSDFELVVFDDASTDDTRQRLDDLCRGINDPRLIVRVHEKNLGFTRGMINAINATDSEYVAVQGSGDISMSSRIERQVEALDSDHGLVSVGCWYESVVEGSGMRMLRRPNANNTNMEKLIKRNVFTHGEVMFRRSKYVQAGGYREKFKYAQDYDLWLRMRHLGRFLTVPQVLYQRFVRADGVSYNARSFVEQMRYAIFAKRIAAATDESRARLYDQLETVPIDTLVSNSDLILNNRVRSALLAAVAFGRFRLADDLLCYLPLRQRKMYGAMVAISENVPFLPRMVGYCYSLLGEVRHNLSSDYVKPAANSKGAN